MSLNTDISYINGEIYEVKAKISALERKIEEIEIDEVPQDRTYFISLRDELVGLTNVLAELRKEKNIILSQRKVVFFLL